jgi:Transglycosylase SLT domain
MTTWVQQIRTQWWFGRVKAVFDAAGIPEWLWEGVMRHESSGNPYAIGYEKDGSVSYGLFQLNSAGVGAGQKMGTLLDPVQNAQLAANQMRGALAPYADQLADPQNYQTLPSPIDLLRRIELAGWPGNDSTLIAAQEPSRIGDLYATLKESGLNDLAAKVQALVASGATASSPTGAQPGQEQGTPGFWGPLIDLVKGSEKTALLYGVATTLFVAGIALARGGGSTS